LPAASQRRLSMRHRTSRLSQCSGNVTAQFPLIAASGGADNTLSMDSESGSAALKASTLNAVLLGGLTLWAALIHPRLAPGVAALATAQALLGLFWRRSRAGRVSTAPVVAFLALSYLGLAYLSATVVGTATATRFWVVFAAAAVIFVPVALLARRLMSRQSRAR
jgi:hypothetical protein